VVRIHSSPQRLGTPATNGLGKGGAVEGGAPGSANDGLAAESCSATIAGFFGFMLPVVFGLSIRPTGPFSKGFPPLLVAN